MKALLSIIFAALLVIGAQAQTVTDSDSSTAAEASHVFKAGATFLYEFSGTNNHTVDQYIQLFDADALPAEGAKPKYVIIVPAGNNFSKVFPTPLRCLKGVVVCNSTTQATKTIGLGNCYFFAQYK